MTPEERDDALLNEHLEGDSALSRLYRRASREQPGAHLDARILGEARRAVARNSRVVHSPFARHWMIPTSLAAVFVLSVSVVLLMPEPPVRPGMHLDDANAPAPARQPAAGDARRDQPATSLERIPAKRANGDTAPEPAAPAGLAAPAEAGRSGRAKSAAPARQESGGAASQVSPALRNRETAKEVMEERKAEDAARESAAETGADRAAPTAPGATAEHELQTLPDASVRDDPRAWLQHIRALLDARDEDAARRNLRAFVTRYPNFPLPAEIQGLAAPAHANPP